MKVLVAIANYGNTHTDYLNRLIREYQSMPYEIDIVVLSDTVKVFGAEIEVIVGLPARDPWSLPFSHRKLFIERADVYDLFIYSEDDTLITRRNIDSFLQVTEVLQSDEIAGFTAYEIDGSGNYSYPAFHGPFRWIPGSVRKYKGYTFARFSNDHSACYLLTRTQLRAVLNSGGYSTIPHAGRYDMLVSAATDPYTQCGLTKVICISHINDFVVHHLPNKYFGRVGISQEDFGIQIEALLSANEGSLHLLRSDKEEGAGKFYFEPIRDDILKLIPPNTRNVLSIGCGHAMTEKKLVEMGMDVVGIPLDSIIAGCATARGVKTTVADFDQAFESLSGSMFNCIIVPEILEYVRNPEEILKQCSKLIAGDGMIIISMTNINFITNVIDKLRSRNSIQWYSLLKVWRTSTRREMSQLFARIGLKEINIIHVFRERLSALESTKVTMLKDALARRIVLAARM